MSGRSSQRKGRRGEAEAARWLEKHGVPTQITARAQAGAGRTTDCADLRFGLAYANRAEVKLRADGFRETYAILGSHEMAILKADRKPRLFVLSAAFAAEVLGAWHERMCEVEGGGR